MTTEQLTIGQVAARTGMTPDGLRYYDRLGLLPPASRTTAGYRLYDRAALDRLTFIRKARTLGLSLDQVQEILRVADRGTPPCEHVRDALAARLADVDARIAELASLRATLRRALTRSRRLPVARSCVCAIIESNAIPNEEAQ